MKKLIFYKRHGYYRLKGKKEIEFCCELFDYFTGNTESRFEIKVKYSAKKGYRICELIQPGKAMGIRLDEYKNNEGYIWPRCWNAIHELLGPVFWFKIQKIKK